MFKCSSIDKDLENKCIQNILKKEFLYIFALY